MQLTAHEVVILLTSLGLGGAAVSLAAKILKKLAKGHLDQDIHTVVLALTGVATGMQYLVQVHSKLPPYIMGISGASIYGVSQWVYKGANWLTGALGDVKKVADNTSMPNGVSTATITANTVTTETPATPTKASF